MPRSSARRVVERVIIFVFILAVFFFLGRSLYRNFYQIPFDRLHFEFLPLLASFLLLGVNYVAVTRVWMLVLDRLGQRIGGRRAFWIVAFSMLAKYIPGFVWSTVGRVFLAAKDGVKEGATVLSMVIENGLLVGSAAIILLTSFFVGRGPVPAGYYALLAVIPVVLILLHPRLAGPLCNWLLARFRRPAVRYRLSYPASLGLLAIFIVFVWLSQAFGFYLLIASVYPIGLDQFPALLRIYVISFLLGYFSPIPGGLGVREGSLALLLPALMPVPLAVAVGFLSRIWATVFELVSAGITFLVHRLGLTRRT